MNGNELKAIIRDTDKSESQWRSLYLGVIARLFELNEQEDVDNLPESIKIIVMTHGNFWQGEKEKV